MRRKSETYVLVEFTETATGTVASVIVLKSTSALFERSAIQRPIVKVPLHSTGEADQPISRPTNLGRRFSTNERMLSWPSADCEVAAMTSDANS